MSKVVILRGVPGSGKSTYIAKYKANSVPWIYVASLGRDDIRKRLFGNESSHGVDEERVTKEFMVDFHYYLDTFRRYKDRDDIDFVLFIDNTNCDWSRVLDLVEIVKPYDIPVEIVVIDTPLDEALRRNAARDRVVPEHVIHSMYAQLQETKDKTL